MELAAEISAEKLQQKIGRSMRVLVDRADADGATARSAGDAPEIDGVVRIHDAKGLAAGDWANVRISGASAYDLEANLDT